MKPSEVFSQHRETIRRIVLESGMENPRLFGSVLHGDDIDGSDLDLLIDIPPAQASSTSSEYSWLSKIASVSMFIY